MNSEAIWGLRAVVFLLSLFTLCNLFSYIPSDKLSSAIQQTQRLFSSFELGTENDIDPQQLNGMRYLLYDDLFLGLI